MSEVPRPVALVGGLVGALGPVPRARLVDAGRLDLSASNNGPFQTLAPSCAHAHRAACRAGLPRGEAEEPGSVVGSAVVKLPLSPAAGRMIRLGAWAFVERGGRWKAMCNRARSAIKLFVFLNLQPLNIRLRLVLPVPALGFVGVIARARRDGGSTLAPFSAGYRVVNADAIGQASTAVRDRHRQRPFVAVNASELTVCAHETLAWLPAHCPVHVIDDAVLVYRFDRVPDLVDGPETPAAPCRGAVSRRG